MADIFISYSREDLQRATLLAEALRQAGYSVWWDREIPPGQTWDEYIGQALTSAKCVVALWSKTSVASRWVREEADTAAGRSCLIPVLIDTVNPPFGFGRFQTADLRTWHGDPQDAEFLKLRAAISAFIEPNARNGTTPPIPPPPRPSPRPIRKGTILWVAAALVAAGLIAFYLVPRRSPRNSASVPASGAPETQALPAEANTFRLTVAPNPPAVGFGERAQITVTVEDANHNRVPSAAVMVSAGGGKFLALNESFNPTDRLMSPDSASGYTDASGVYITSWACNPCTSKYEMSATADKTGFVHGAQDFSIAIRSRR